MAAISPTRQENYPGWYQQIILEADLAQSSDVRGCMVIKPWGYGIWQRIQTLLNQRIETLGYENAYFPLLIPLRYLEKEAEHIEGFAKECAVVTHHRLLEKDGKLIPDGKLEEPLVIRPTSETIIGESMSKWIQSYRDLPMRLNQWANVMRWEMRTRLFLRTSEFLWHEGHAAYDSAKIADDEAHACLSLYQSFVEDVLAMPVIAGEKTEAERFPGAERTYCIEAMMQDGKALQAGTSHFLGQHFSRSANIQYLNDQGEQAYAWTTSFGASTRLIGGLIMMHSDDDGLVLPPKVAPKQVVILPIYRNEEDRQAVLAACTKLKEALEEQSWSQEVLRVVLDDRDMRGGDKAWQWVKKGIPVRLEIGPRDLSANTVVMKRRDQAVSDKTIISWQDCVKNMPDTLAAIQNVLWQRACDYQTDMTMDIDSERSFDAFFAQKSGFARCFAVDNVVVQERLAALNVTARCLPWQDNETMGKCIFTGEQVKGRTIFAKAY